MRAHAAWRTTILAVSSSSPCALSCVVCTDEDLVMLADDVCLGAGVFLVAHELTRNGKFKRAPIVVNVGCTVGPAARLTPGVTTEAGSYVPALLCALPQAKPLLPTQDESEGC